MKKYFSILGKRTVRIPLFEYFEDKVSRFSVTERVIFYSASTLFCLSALALLFMMQEQVSLPVAARGGVLREGIVGTIRTFNPLFAATDADRDFARLVFAGLTAYSDTGFTPVLADTITISPDSKTYRITIKRNATFHDGTPVTAEDVRFTIERIQNTGTQSAFAPLWQGVQVRVIDLRTIELVLENPYANFSEALTTPIIPEHIWKDIDPAQMAFTSREDAIGAGPYALTQVQAGATTETEIFNLRSFDGYVLGAPYIETIELHTFDSIEKLQVAFKEGLLDSTPEFISESEESVSTATSVLPRLFAAFFNSGAHRALAQSEVREALSLAVDRQTLIDETLGEIRAVAINTPRGFLVGSTTANITRAKELLKKAGWKVNSKDGVLEKKVGTEMLRLDFTISTAQSDDLTRVAQELQLQWNEIGIRTDIKVFELGDLNQNIISPRRFEILVFGQSLGRERSLYPYWHSLEREAPGYNISLYANQNVDKLLVKSESSTTTEERTRTLTQAEQLITKDIPAVFLYSPNLQYTRVNRIFNLTLPRTIEYPSDRFNLIHRAYITTQKLWPFFITTDNIIHKQN